MLLRDLGLTAGSMAAALVGRMSTLSLSSQQRVEISRFQGFRALPACGQCGLRRGAAVQSVRGRTPLRVQAARVAGVDIPNQKRIEYSLQYIYGVGHTTAKAILADTAIENKRTRDLSEEELTKLRDEIEKYSVEGDLRRFNALNIKRLKEIGCYRGRRHVQGLPMHGQKTKTNARTRKGKKVAIAGKKK